jgi:prepilin-type N-terminal cleavage/methylation domain-containing protein
MKKKQAFSLIELSIVILIIGILVAGVTSSSRLIRAMKLISAKQMTQSSPVLTIQDLLAWFEPTKDGVFGTGSAGNYTQQASPDNGQPIATWMDGNPRLVSGSQIVATQSSLSNQPLYVENGMNGLPSLNFVDDDFLQYDDNIGGSTGATLFIVFKPHDFLTFRQTFMGGGINFSNSNDGNKCLTLIHVNNTTWYGGWGSTNTVSSFNIVSPSICRFVYRSGSFQTFTNGVGDTPQNIGSAQPLSRVDINPPNYTKDTIGSNARPVDYQWNYHGYIGELIIYGRGLKNEESIDIEKYLAKKWGVKLPY